MANKKNIKKEKRPVQTEILIRPMHRGVNDVGRWRSALRLADMGNRTKLYDLYTDLLIDGYLSDAIDKRIDAVTDADLVFTVKAKEIDGVNNLMDTPEFEDFLREIMLSRFWGISVVECFYNDGFSFYSVPRNHIRPKTKEIARREEDQTGISYAGVDNIIQFGKDDDYGIILRACVYVIYKRGGFGDWAQFVEIFGMPQRIGKYSSMDEQSRRALIEAFETAGSAPYLVIPKETEATQTTLSTAASGALYNDFRQACNEEILITLLGQTMATIDGSSLAQGRVHLEVQEKKHRSDRRYTERMLNKFFVPWLEKRGLPVKGGKFHFRDKAKELTVDEVDKIAAMINVPASWIHETYNIPMAKAGEAVAKRQVVREEIDVEGEGARKKTNVKTENSDKAWYRRLWDFFVSAPQDGAISGNHHMRLNDDSLDSRLANRIADAHGQAYFDAELFYFMADALTGAVRTGYGNGTTLRMADFVYGINDDACLTAMEQNVFHFSAAKTLAEIQELNRLFRESGSFEEFYKKASETTDVFNRTWQRTEYDTALLTAEAASTYQRLMQKTKLFPYWEYRTAGDDRVRPEHRALEGVVLPANDPRWNKIYPPNGWRCRCYVVPRMAHEVKDVNFDSMRARVDEFFDSPEWQQSQAQGWGVNRARDAEVFSADQMYIRKFPNQAAKLLDKVTPPDWGIKKSFGTLLKEAVNVIQPYTGTAEEWWKANAVTVDGQTILQVKDYNGRTLTMGKIAFDVHTSNIKKTRLFRREYLSHIRETAASPDEVWLGRSNKKNRLDNYIMIRYYKDTALAVVSNVEDGELVLKTWFEVRSKKVRSGLLIKYNKPD